MRRLAQFIAMVFVASVVLAPATAQAVHAAPAPTPDATVYRFWSLEAQSHFYTSDLGERDYILRNYDINEWRYEGPAYRAFSTQVEGTTPLFRFWSEEYRGHFYTLDPLERDEVIDRYAETEWMYEGIAFYVYPSDAAYPDLMTVARFWSPQNRHHFYTADAAEAEFVRSSYPDEVWTFEGDAFRAPPAPGPPYTFDMIDAKDCGDFENWFYAQGWYKFYFPTYGDIAGLDDGEQDGLVCKDLQYAPPFGILPPGVIPWWFGRW